MPPTYSALVFYLRRRNSGRGQGQDPPTQEASYGLLAAETVDDAEERAAIFSQSKESLSLDAEELKVEPR